ncbi:MFS transporter [Ideonella sp. A 288]|uniref:MFS transporter n=1 Tax=Ideonella sp. A 288 TaxID=1962181 RepID=UPI001F2B39DB|nr:MFS transporter [Ideonella sp. A 288]
MAEPWAAPRAGGGRRLLLSLIFGQLMLHSAMAGQRMAAPLQALQAGHEAWAVGLLLALFAALPVLTAMGAGRMADRHGYHRPVHLAVALTTGGAALAVVACWLPDPWRFGLLCVGAAASGVGTNVGLIAIQRTAGQLVTTSTERLRVFSWLGMAPSLANVVGPVVAGFVIDGAGYAWAYAVMMVLPLTSLVFARGVPKEAGRVDPAQAAPRGRAWDLLAVPGLKRLLFVNWLLSASWDVHSFAVPVLGHARSYPASTIGLVLGTFTLAVTLVRFVIPLLAHRLDEVAVLRTAMVLTGLVFAAYPFAGTPWLMGLCATLLGLTLGAVQPMIMSTLHQLTPDNRHGEVIAFRSMAINASSSIMPLAFGLAGTALGPGVMFWIMGAAVGAGSWPARGLKRAFERPHDSAG